MNVSLKPTIVNITGVTRNTDFTITCVIKRGGVVENISNRSVRLTIVNPKTARSVVVITNTSTDHEDPLNGKTKFRIPKSAIADLAKYGSEMLQYEIRGIIPDGAGTYETVHFKGSITIEPTAMV